MFAFVYLLLLNLPDFLFSSTMAQITFQSINQTFTPSCSSESCTDPITSKRRETDSLKKSRFFDIYDRGRNQCPFKPLKIIYEKPHVKSRTAHEWLSKRRQLSSPALRRIRKLTAQLRRKEKLSSY